MKSKLKLFLMLIAMVILISIPVFATDTTVATSEPEGEPVVTSETPNNDENAVGNETNNEENYKIKDMFYSGDDIEISDLVDANVYAIGKNIRISGKIAGDLFVISESLIIDTEAEIYGNVFAVVGQADINGAMYDTRLVCDTFNLGYDGYIYRDLVVNASEIKLNGRVLRNSYLEADTLTLDTDFLTAESIYYTAQSEAKYINKLEDGSTEETTTIPESVVPKEKVYTHRDKKLFSKEVKKSVDKILKSNKVTNNMSEEKVKEIFVANAFNFMGVKSNSNVVKGVTKTITIPMAYMYIYIAIIVVLVIGIILPIILKKSKMTKES